MVNMSTTSKRHASNLAVKRVTKHVDLMPVFSALKYQRGEVAVVAPPRDDITTSDSHRRFTAQPLTKIILRYNRRHVTNHYTCIHINNLFIHICLGKTLHSMHPTGQLYYSEVINRVPSLLYFNDSHLQWTMLIEEMGLCKENCISFLNL